MKIQVMMLGIMLFTIPILPLSTAQDKPANPLPQEDTTFKKDEFPNGGCWDKIEICLNESVNQMNTNPKFNFSSPSFNMSEYLCCPMMKKTVQIDKPCFCNLNTFLHQNPIYASNYSVILIGCSLPSANSLDALCSSVGATPPVSYSTRSTKPGKKNTVVIAIATASASALLLTIAIAIAFYCWKKKQPDQVARHVTVKEDEPHNQPAHVSSALDNTITPEPLQYEFRALKAATNNFSYERKLGQGGFGVVYKGVLRNGEEIAVKRLSLNSSQGNTEFQNEAAFVAKLQHRNLVRLLGFCLAKEEKLLVYEFVKNKSLDYFIFDLEKQKQLDWPKRYNIIRGVARGMLYLHEDSPMRIIHRDLKAGNVSLDGDMNPKIADFGLARIFELEQTHASASRIVGTSGYMAPEFVIHGQYSVKSDVYSFGVLVLEIVSGKRVTTVINQRGGAENLITIAWKCLRDINTLKFMDPTLTTSYREEEIVRCIHIGLLCVQEEMKKRPTMEKIVHMFNSNVDVNSLAFPQHPPSFMFGGGYSTASLASTVQWSSSQPSISESSATAR